MANKIKIYLDRFMFFTTSVFLIITLIMLLWQVFSRYVLSSPSTFTNELLGFLLVWMSLLGASYAFGSNEHLALELLKNRLKKNKFLLVNIIGNLFILIFAIFVLIIGGVNAMDGMMAQLTPILQIPEGWLYLILPISGVIIIIYKVLNSFIYIQENKGGD